MVRLARSFVDDVEFSPMDATRTELSYLLDVLDGVVEAGASTVNIPDTVGYTTPEEFGKVIKAIKERLGDRAIISVHCHNDLGLSVANSLSAVLNGARQVTINGIGERAGNCSMEEVVMALRTRKDFYKVDTKINTVEIIRTSRLLTRITGMAVQANKAIVGANAFAHEAGIHQDGLLKEKTTYEIINPESIGLQSMKLVLGKHSGRHAFKTRLKDLGYDLTDEEIESAFERFKHLADQKKDIYDEDIETLVSEEVSKVPEIYSLVSLEVKSGTETSPLATLGLSVNEKLSEMTSSGDGPVDATYKCIATLTQTKSRLMKYEVKGITGGTDALGEVAVTLEEGDHDARGSGSDTDIIVASAKAYINALNRLEAQKRKAQKGV